MDTEYVEIIAEAEDAWRNNSLTFRQVFSSAEEYRIKRDLFKAYYILQNYNYEYFRLFVDRCPHILNIIKNYGCSCLDKDDPNCNLFCIFYRNGGCS